MMVTMVPVVCCYKILYSWNISHLLLENVIRKRGRPPKPKPVGKPKNPQGCPRKPVDSSQPIQQMPKPVGRPPHAPRYTFQPQVDHQQILNMSNSDNLILLSQLSDQHVPSDPRPTLLADKAGPYVVIVDIQRQMNIL
jgi:hypothetical protein